MNYDAAFRQGRTFSEFLDTVQENADLWHSITRFTRGARSIPVVVFLDEEGDEELKEQG